MQKQELISAFSHNHQTFVHYIDRLRPDQFILKPDNKWTPGQHLNHILLTLQPFPKVLGSKEYIAEKFGKTDRASWDYDTVISNYLQTTRKAAEQYVPGETVTFAQKPELMVTIQETMEKTTKLLNTYTEEELDTLLLPHPLLGKMTLRELFYLMSYHPMHHLKQVKTALGEAVI